MTDVRAQLPRSGTYMRRPLSAITKFAIHWDAMYRPHDYDSITRYVGEANMHINKDWGGGARGDGLMYHIKIDNVGEVFQCRDYEDVLWNVGGAANYNTLAVCFDCGADQAPTREQVESFKTLMDDLCNQHPEFPASQGDVYGHRDFNATQCPGDRFEQMVNEYRNSGNVTVSDLSYDWPPTVNVAPPAPVPTPPIAETPAPIVLPVPEDHTPTPGAVDPTPSVPTPEPEKPVVVPPTKPTNPFKWLTDLLDWLFKKFKK